MVAGRVGSGIAAELGSMMVTEQIAALRALGTDPIRKLVLPRMLAGLVMVPLLTVMSGGVGMVGGWIVTVTQLQVPSSRLLEQRRAGPLHPGRLDGADQAVLPRLHDRRASAATSGCGRRGGTQGVGRATTNAVVASSVAVIAVDFLVTKLLIVLMY